MSLSHVLTGAIQIERSEDLNPSNWRYKGEGARNMVFQFIGPNPSRFIHSVMRLSKHSLKSDEPKESVECSCKTNYEFLRDVICPRISADLLVLGELISVSEEFLDQLHRNSVPLRPPHRLKTSLDTHAALGWLLPDLSYLPEFCKITVSQASVEIKPKCGILPQIACLNTENSIKSNISRYQMMQFLKLVEGKVVSISKYNPLDLFCGDIERMASALRALFSEPQNNFRLCIDGDECIGDALELKSQSILNFFSSAFESSDEMSDLSKILATILMDCRVLDEIRRLQELDRFDIESVGLIYRHLTNPSTFSVTDVRQQAPCSYLPPENEWEQVVQDFLIAQSAKDCSVMLTMVLLPRATDSSSAAVAPLRCVDCLDPPCTILYRVALVSSARNTTSDIYMSSSPSPVDLDLKDRGRIPGYYEQDKQVLKAYQAAMGSKACPLEAGD